MSNCFSYFDEKIVDLFACILQIINETKQSKVKLYCFALLVNFAEKKKHVNKIELMDALDLSMKTIEEEEIGSMLKAKVFMFLKILAREERNCETLMRKVYSLTIATIQQEAIASEIRENMFGMLLNLTYEVNNRIKMIEIIALTIQVIKEEPIGSKVKNNVFRILTNVAFEAKNRVIMMEKMFDVTIQVIKEEPIGSNVKENAFRMLWNLL